MSLSLSIRTSAFVEAALAGTVLLDRLGWGQIEADWLASVSAFHDLGGVVGEPPGATLSVLDNIRVGRVNAPDLREVLRRRFGSLGVARAVCSAATRGRVTNIDQRARRISPNLRSTVLDIDARMSSAFPGARRPDFVEDDVRMRLIAGVVDLGRQLCAGATEGQTDMMALRASAQGRLADLGITHARWPDAVSAASDLSSVVGHLPLDPGIAVLEGHGDMLPAALAYGLRLREARRIDSIIVACSTRANVLYRFDAVGTLMPHVPAVRGLPWDTSPEDSWFTARCERYLFAPICVTTQEQVFNAIRKESHACMRTAAMARSLLILDDIYTTKDLDQARGRALCFGQILLGGFAVTTSTVLDNKRRIELLMERWPETPNEELREAHSNTGASAEAAVGMPYACVTYGRRMGERTTFRGVQHPSSLVTLIPLQAPPTVEEARQAIAREAMRHFKKGAKVLVFANTYLDVLGVAQTINTLDDAALLRVNDQPVAYHSRYMPQHRSAIYRATVAELGVGTPQHGRIVVASQQVENGLPLDADIIITDFAPVDSLLRRAWRMHVTDRLRPQGYEQPRMIVVMPPSMEPGEWDFAQQIHPRTGHPLRSVRGLGSKIYPNMFALQHTLGLLLGSRTLDRGNPRTDTEMALHERHVQATITGDPEDAEARNDLRWSNHNAWLCRTESAMAVVSALRWNLSAATPYGDRYCDAHVDDQPREPEGAYIPSDAVLRIYFPTGTTSLLGASEGPLVIFKERNEVLHDLSSVTPDAVAGVLHFGNSHIYDNWGERRRPEEEEDDE